MPLLMPFKNDFPISPKVWPLLRWQSSAMHASACLAQRSLTYSTLEGRISPEL